MRRDHSYRSQDNYARLKEGVIETLVQRTVDVLPEAAGHVVHQELATPLTQERYTQSTNGACYGIELSVRQFGVRRPGPVTEIDGLFLAGASCRPGPATEGVMISGLQAASAVMGRDLLAEFRSGRPLVEATVFPVVSAVEWDALAHARGRRGAARSHREAADAGAVQ